MLERLHHWWIGFSSRTGLVRCEHVRYGRRIVWRTRICGRVVRETPHGWM